MIYIGIVGSRDFTNYEFVSKEINKYLQTFKEEITIVSGDCRGIDFLVQRYSKEFNIPFIKHVAQWDKYGKRAGPIRNKQIVDSITHLLAFPKNTSIGTFSTINLAKKKKVLITVITI